MLKNNLHPRASISRRCSLYSVHIKKSFQSNESYIFISRSLISNNTSRECHWWFRIYVAAAHIPRRRRARFKKICQHIVRTFVHHPQRKHISHAATTPSRLIISSFSHPHQSNIPLSPPHINRSLLQPKYSTVNYAREWVFVCSADAKNVYIFLLVYVGGSALRYIKYAPSRNHPQKRWYIFYDILSIWFFNNKCPINPFCALCVCVEEYLEEPNMFRVLGSYILIIFI